MNPTLEEMVTGDAMATDVLAQLDKSDPVICKAFTQWLKSRRDELNYEPLGTVVHRFTSPTLRELTVKFFLAVIATETAVLRLRLAQQRREEASLHLQAGLSEHDLFFGEKGDTVHESRMEVRRISKLQELDLIRKLVQFSRDLAEDGLALTPERVASGELPDFLKGVPIQIYTSELAEYVVHRGDLGKEVIRRICDDAEFANLVEQDEQSPRPLRHLADMANTVRKSTTAKTREIGFAVA